MNGINGRKCVVEHRAIYVTGEIGGKEDSSRILLQNSGEPIYQQIATQLKQDILSVKLSIFLPSGAWQRI